MNACEDRVAAAPETVLRFMTTERLLHWAIAIPFLGCLLSATVLVVVYNPDPTRPYRYLFAWVHRGCGTGLMLCPSLVLLASLRRLDIHFYNLRQAWVWTLDDIRWLALMGPATFSQRFVLPDQGKFNAAEKLNFMMVMTVSPLLIVSGVLIWFPDLSRLGSFAPWLVHCGLVALGLPLILGHMFMATINPSTRVGLSGMITGFVSREWAAHHYTRWFREQFPHLAEAHDGHRTGDAPAEPSANLGAAFPLQPPDGGPLVVADAEWLDVLAAAHAPFANSAFGDMVPEAAIARARHAAQSALASLPLDGVPAAGGDVVCLDDARSRAAGRAMAAAFESRGTVEDGAGVPGMACHDVPAAPEARRAVGKRTSGSAPAPTSSLAGDATERAAVGWSR